MHGLNPSPRTNGSMSSKQSSEVKCLHRFGVVDK